MGFFLKGRWGGRKISQQFFHLNLDSPIFFCPPGAEFPHLWGLQEALVRNPSPTWAPAQPCRRQIRTPTKSRHPTVPPPPPKEGVVSVISHFDFQLPSESSSGLNASIVLRRCGFFIVNSKTVVLLIVY